MTFTLFLNEQGEILKQLLELYYPSRRSVKVIDLTFGRGALWSTVMGDSTLRAKYKVTKCDATPSVPGVRRKNLLTDDYSELCRHDVALFDPPYLIGRHAFDYSKKETSKKSWAKAGGLKKHTSNQTLKLFNHRVECLSEKACTFLRPKGVLLVKIMDPRRDGSLIPHHINVANTLHNSFELIDLAVFMRLGATTWKIRGNLQNLHGYWLVFRLRDRTEPFACQGKLTNRKSKCVRPTFPRRLSETLWLQYPRLFEGTKKLLKLEDADELTMGIGHE